MGLSLKSKLILGGVAAIAISAISFGYVSYSNMNNEAWRAIKSESSNTAQANARGVGDWLLGKRHALEGLTEAIENNGSLDIISRLKQTYKSGEFALSFYGDANGEMFRHDPPLNKAGYDPRARRWYKDALAANSYIMTKPFVSSTLNSLVVTLANPVRKNGNIIGVAASALALDKLS